MILRKKLFFKFEKKALIGDITGGLTAGVVALPLALAFGVASGAGAASGLYGAILVGFFAAVFGGTPSQVSGPTGPMTVVMTAVIMHFADRPATAFTVVVLGGVFQIIFGYLKLGRYITFIPVAVISGFMSGIGLLIVLLQLPIFLGYNDSLGSPLATLLALPSILMAVSNWSSVIIGFSALACIIFLPILKNKKIPPALVALVVATLVGVNFFPDSQTIGNIPSGLPTFILPDISLTDLPEIISYSLMIAALGSIDTLLTSLIADSLTRKSHDSDRELFGQGIGNIIAGFFGGLPGAGATMRTVINIRSGGATPMSSIIHSVFLVLLLLGAGSLAENIPLAALAGILFKVGWDIIDWNFLRRLKGIPLSSIGVMILVMILTVITDLLTAVVAGIVISHFVSAQKISMSQLDNILISLCNSTSITDIDAAVFQKPYTNDVTLLKLRGVLTFQAAKAMVKKFNEFDSESKFTVIDLSELSLIDENIAMGISEVIDLCYENGQTIHVIGTTSPCFKLLESMNVMEKVKSENIHPKLSLG